MELTIETITPKQAQKYLSFNTSNRRLRKSLVSMYAKDMRNGNWKLTHQGVAFNCDGTLLDGQHRLSAIVESGVTIQMVVVRGVAAENQLVMDDHAKRNASDAISLVRGEKITTDMVAIIRAATELQGVHEKSTKNELNDLIATFQKPLEFVSEFIQTKQRGITSAPVFAAMVLAWYYVPDLGRLREFARMLTGVDMCSEETDRAAVVLREWLLRTGARGALRTEAFRKTQRAIVAFVERKKIEKIYGTSVHYPFPLVDPVRR